MFLFVVTTISQRVLLTTAPFILVTHLAAVQDMVKTEVMHTASVFGCEQ